MTDASKQRAFHHFVGIDPGWSGAIARISCVQEGGKFKFGPESKFVVMDCPNATMQPEDSSLSLPAQMHAVARTFLLSASKSDSRFVVLEKVSARPKDGRASLWKFGENFGIWQGVLSGYCPHGPVMVLPAVWKRQFDLIHKKKGESIKRCVEIMPRTEEMLGKAAYHNRAEAFLLAYYGLLLKQATLDQLLEKRNGSK